MGDPGGSSVGELLVGRPGVDNFDLEATLSGLIDDEVSQQLLEHLLGGEGKLGIEPNGFGHEGGLVQLVLDLDDLADVLRLAQGQFLLQLVDRTPDVFLFKAGHVEHILVVVLVLDDVHPHPNHLHLQPLYQPGQILSRRPRLLLVVVQLLHDRRDVVGLSPVFLDS